jgi:2-hydroxychromene-2-carboxylate isomerase
MSGPTIEFWFSIGSTYAYLTAMRLEELAKSSGVEVRWRPFSVRAIMIEQKNIPFTGKPVKMAYMWRDIERRAEAYGFPARVPAPYPLAEFDRANRVAIVASEEGWAPAYVRQSYRRWFQEGEEPGLEPNLRSVLAAIGQDPDRALARASSEAVGRAYLAATDEGKRLNVFGSPSFVVSGEVFWGDDRLDDAIRWAKRPG